MSAPAPRRAGRPASPPSRPPWARARSAPRAARRRFRSVPRPRARHRRDGPPDREPGGRARRAASQPSARSTRRRSASRMARDQPRPRCGPPLAGSLTSIGAATVAVATTAQALDVSLETAPGEAIPVVGFGRLTLFFTVIGVLIARTIGRRARQPRSTLIRTTLVLTALSVVPDVLLSTDAAT